MDFEPIRPIINKYPHLFDGVRQLMTEQDCVDMRRRLKIIADELYAMAHSRVYQHEEREVPANAMLAYRHLEDASMRLGKVIQAINGGVSVYDKTQVPAA